MQVKGYKKHQKQSDLINGFSSISINYQNLPSLGDGTISHMWNLLPVSMLLNGLRAGAGVLLLSVIVGVPLAWYFGFTSFIFLPFYFEITGTAFFLTAITIMSNVYYDDRTVILKFYTDSTISIYAFDGQKNYGFDNVKISKILSSEQQIKSFCDRKLLKEKKDIENILWSSLQTITYLSTIVFVAECCFLLIPFS